MSEYVEEMLSATMVEVSKLELGPNDTLVIRTPYFRNANDINEFKRQLVSDWENAPVGRILILPKDFELSVLKQLPDTVARSA